MEQVNDCRCAATHFSWSWRAPIVTKMSMALFGLLLLVGTNVPARAQSLQCYGDIKTCMNVCINVGETPSPNRDCDLACSVAESTNGRSCFRRHFPAAGSSAPNKKLDAKLYEQLYLACDKQVCSPPFVDQSTECYKAWRRSRSDGEFSECTKKAYRDSMPCSKRCMEGAMKQAIVPVK